MSKTAELIPSKKEGREEEEGETQAAFHLMSGLILETLAEQECGNDASKSKRAHRVDEEKQSLRTAQLGLHTAQQHMC